MSYVSDVTFWHQLSFDGANKVVLQALITNLEHALSRGHDALSNAEGNQRL